MVVIVRERENGIYTGLYQEVEVIIITGSLPGSLASMSPPDPYPVILADLASSLTWCPR